MPANNVHRCYGTKETIDSLLDGPHKEIWHKSLSNDRALLDQGNDFETKVTDTIEFIRKSDVPFGKKVTYC